MKLCRIIKIIILEQEMARNEFRQKCIMTVKDLIAHINIIRDSCEKCL